MACEGYYIFVNKNAPQVPHKRFFVWVDYIEFLYAVLSPNCKRCNIKQCERLSAFMGALVESYEHEDSVVYFTNSLFLTAEDADEFIKHYVYDNFTGTRADLAARSQLNLENYVQGRIAVALDHDIPINGILVISFHDEGIVVLPMLYRSMMHFTKPEPGYFTRVEIDDTVPLIKFYTDP